MRAREFLPETELRKSVKGPLKGVHRNDSLDNSSPYNTWRFIVAMAGAPDQHMDNEGPFGQKLITMAYTDACDKIITSTEKMLGFKSKRLTSHKSVEDDTTLKASPISNWQENDRKKSQDSLKNTEF